MKTKDYKGITLIALVITIIVLLILAGVSISMLAGDNGILNQTVNASVATDIANTKEQIELALIGYYDESGNYTISDVEQAVADSGATLGDDGVSVTTANGNTFDISDLVNAATVEMLSASDISANPTKYYGVEITNYGTSENKSESYDWKIFYADSSNIYLITSGYILATDAPSNSSGTPIYGETRPYSVYLANTYSAYDGASGVDESLWSLNSLWYAKFSSSTFSNADAMAYLLDIDIWSIFKNNNYAEYAIGGAPLEMWVASYNSKGYTELFCDNVIETGYYIGLSSPASSKSQDVTSAEVEVSGYEDSLYFPYQEDYHGTSCYWLASPSSNSVTCEFAVSSNRNLGRSRYKNWLWYVSWLQAGCMSKERCSGS